MAESQNVFLGSLDLVERPLLRLFDFDRIQVAPQRMDDYEDFRSRSFEERRELLIKLINRVKSL